MFGIELVERIKINILCSVTFFPAESRAVYEVMVKNMVETDRTQMAI